MDNIETNYTDHNVFDQLQKLKVFYEYLSFSISGSITTGVSIVNIDTFILSSMNGTIESIIDILRKGKINDSYALLRKLYDLVILNIYTNLYLEENISMDNFFSNDINKWVKGKKKAPSFKMMSDYIIKSKKLKEITFLIYKNGTYKGSVFDSIRQRCNEHTHYVFFQNMLSNIYKPYKTDIIDNINKFSTDLTDIFILHFSYLFTIKQHYMMSSDYMDYMDLNISPPDNSQYMVSKFVQDIFDSIIKVNRPDIASILIKTTSMDLR